MQLFLLTAVVIQIGNKYEDKVRKYLANLLFLGLFVASIINFGYTVLTTNSLKFLNWQQINYSIGKTDIYDWIDYRFPRMKHAIKWCEDPPGGESMALARFDPDMIWYSYDGFMRVFLTNCYYRDPPLHGLALDEVLKTAKEKELDFWTATPNPCVEDSEVKPSREYEDEDKIFMRRLNNIIVCNSEEVLPHLYHFDYRNLSGSETN
jgi:hypothetical protein